MAWAQIHRARISNRYNFITKAVIAMRKKATDVLTTVFKLGRIWAFAVKAIESYEIRQRGRRGGEILMGSGSRLGNVTFRRPDWPHALPSEWGWSFGLRGSKLYKRDGYILLTYVKVSVQRSCLRDWTKYIMKMYRKKRMERFYMQYFGINFIYWKACKIITVKRTYAALN